MFYYETNLVVHKEKLIGGIPNNNKKALNINKRKQQRTKRIYPKRIVSKFQKKFIVPIGPSLGGGWYLAALTTY